MARVAMKSTLRDPDLTAETVTPGRETEGMESSLQDPDLTAETVTPGRETEGMKSSLRVPDLTVERVTPGRETEGMKSSLQDPSVAARVEAVAAEMDALLAADLTPADADDAVALVRECEVLRRRADALCVHAMDAIDRSGAHIEDGHGSVKVMARHIARLSNAEAAARDNAMRVARELPEIGEAYRRGEVGTDQLRALGRVHANRRVRDRMVDAQDWFLRHAQRNSFKDFHRVARRWENMTDEDGADPHGDITHDRRNAQLIEQFDGSWDLAGRFGSFQGAAMHTIFGHYIDAEREADWEKARAEHGDDACADHLARTEAQRRADALWQLFQDAASAPAGAVPPGFVHNIIWDRQTYEAMVRQLDGQSRGPLDVDSSRCETIDGISLNRTEAAANSLVNQIRRVIVDAKGTVIDLGRARFFTGHARHAVKLANTSCVWPGCEVPSSVCEADHLQEHAKGGRTNPDQGAPLCGKHNRWKQKGFSIHRDPAGYWHTIRPDRTPVP